MTHLFHAMPTHAATAIRTSGRDAYGRPVECRTAHEPIYPCRHCLGTIPAGEDYLVLAYRPFETTNPYAETGPIFLCAKACKRATPSPEVPTILISPDYIVRGYDAEERIVYGTGQVTPTAEIGDYAGELLANPDIAFVDVRSARNNCWQCRVMRS